MNTTLIDIDPITERFSVALFIAAVIHLIVIYGLSFGMPKTVKPAHTTMEIILIQKKTNKTPKEANYLAQVSHEGGGEQPDKARPTTPTIAPFPDKVANLVQTPPPPQVALAPEKEETKILAIDKMSEHLVVQQETMIPTDKSSEQGNALQTLKLEEYNMTENLMFINSSIAKMASIQAELDDKFEDYSKRPRKKFINSSTKEDKYVEYMYQWCKSIEKMGTDYYRNQAKLQNITGNVMLDVAINSDGTVRSINIKKPSKHSVINEAVKRIIHKTPAFMPFPQNIRKETDILHITRTWNFNYHGLRTK